MDKAKYKENLDNCRFCTMCRQVCPAALATQRESAAPRGLSLAMFAVDKGITPLTQEVHKHLVADCTLCGACYESCITQQDLPALILETRARAVSAGAACTEALATRDNVVSTGNPFGAAVASQRFSPANHSETAEVVFFPGCTALFFEHNVIHAIEGILTAAKINYTIPDGADCCGAPLKELGFEKDFADHSGILGEKIASTGAATLVTACATCAYWMKLQFAEIPSLAKIRVINFVDYLQALVKDGRITLKSRTENPVRLQQPCRIARSLNRFDPTIELLKQVNGIKLDQFSSEKLVDVSLRVPESLCCGGCGGTRFVDLATADKIAAYQVEKMAANTITLETVLTSCVTCKYMLGRAAERAHVKVFHVAEVLVAEAKG